MCVSMQASLMPSVLCFQVNGHQIMDEAMEEGESFTHCVSNVQGRLGVFRLLRCT